MTELAHRTIAALRHGHDDLAARVQAMSDHVLAETSGASGWDVAKVLNHLGSGAEIGLGTLRSQLDPSGATPAPDYEAVWERWHAMDRRRSAASFVESNDRLVSAYEALDDEVLRDARIDLAFLSEPIDIAALAAMRLSEQTLHGWDIEVAQEPTAALAAEAVPCLLDRADPLIGFFGKAAMLAHGPAVVAVKTSDPARSFVLVIDDRVWLQPDGVAGEPTATLELPGEAWLRLVAGRLRPPHLPDGVRASGAVSLDQLRGVFPGY